jgi:hypothetical protein
VKFFMTQFSPASRHVIHPWSRSCPQHPVPKPLRSCSSLSTSSSCSQVPQSVFLPFHLITLFPSPSVCVPPFPPQHPVPKPLRFHSCLEDLGFIPRLVSCGCCLPVHLQLLTYSGRDPVNVRILEGGSTNCQ